VNHSGDNATFLTITRSSINVSFISQKSGGVTTNHTATCTITSSPDFAGAPPFVTLAPHEVRMFSYSCTGITPSLQGNTSTLTTVVAVNGAGVCNQLLQCRTGQTFTATSPDANFGSNACASAGL
jgi:hypothetical protein